MNWEHFRTFLWLRWRLRINQLRRSGAANIVFLCILAGGAILIAITLFVILLMVGLFALGQAPSFAFLYIWDGLVVAFLFSWAIGLLIELQRAEAFSLYKFLHLPVSLSSAFLINYLSSLVNLTSIVFVPAMLGLIIGLSVSRGPVELVTLPLAAAFIFMVTALTYQFQGWLATLMGNPRRRRTVIVLVIMVLVVLCQLPNLINLYRPWDEQALQHINERMKKEYEELTKELTDKTITPDEYSVRSIEIGNKYNAEKTDLAEERLQQVERVARIINLVFPPGWLALGAEGVAAGKFVPPLLAFLGLTLIGAASLRRSYRTTVRLYRGEFTGGTVKKPEPTATKPVTRTGPVHAGMVEARLPWMSEQAAAIAMCGLRGWLRAPEAKMMLLAPIILILVFGGLFLSRTWSIPEFLRPLIAFGALSMVLLTVVEFPGNMFGFDRNGFRVFVLSGVPRRDILLGKNLAIAPLILGLGFLLLIPVQFVAPLRVDQVLAFILQAITMYLLFCLITNAMSILAPLQVPAGAFKPASIKGLPLLLRFAFLLLFPMVMGLTLFPQLIELMLQPWLPNVPLAFLLTIVECVAMIFLYRLLLNLEGKWLQAREQAIVEAVTTRAE